MAAEKPLSMVRLELDSARVTKLGKSHGLLHRQGDADYLVHATLAALFGGGVLQPFRVVDPGRRQLPVLAYTTTSEDELRDHAETFADPLAHATCDWSQLAVKPLPASWERRCLGFELRACPVVRLSSEVTTTSKTGDEITYRAGSEVDAWLHRRWLAAEGTAELTREEAYVGWLGDRLGDAAELRSARLTAFRRSRLLRRTQGDERRGKILERPDVILEGELEVRDGAAFQGLLARGVGRHRAFGFGMLLLRPPG
jgi:CRISPR system Cascade subunit CasE